MDRHKLTKEAFEKVSQYTFNNYGINLTPAKINLVENRLSKRVRHLDFESFEAYIEYLFQPHGKGELDLLCDYLSTNKTYFYREPAHFMFLDYYFRSLQPQQNVNVWSAACSGGDEVYTLAMVAEEARRSSNINFSYSILGTDISSRMIEEANEGKFPANRVDPLPKELQQKYLKQLHEDSEKLFYEVKPELKKNVRFKKFNLIKDIDSMYNQFDVIICRNVLIYFADANKQKVVQQLTKNLKPDGILILGHCEGMICKHSTLAQIQPSIFRMKKDE